MSVFVDELTSEVVAESPPAPPVGAEEAEDRWEAEERLRALHARLARDAARVDAEGVDE